MRGQEQRTPSDAAPLSAWLPTCRTAAMVGTPTQPRWAAAHCVCDVPLAGRPAAHSPSPPGQHCPGLPARAVSCGLLPSLALAALWPTSVPPVALLFVLPTQFNYEDGRGFTLVYNGVTLADLAATWDSDGYRWPIIRADLAYRGACACCDLCRAQPNPNVSGPVLHTRRCGISGARGCGRVGGVGTKSSRSPWCWLCCF